MMGTYIVFFFGYVVKKVQRKVGLRVGSLCTQWFAFGAAIGSQQGD
jgi:hypothetical protein